MWLAQRLVLLSLCVLVLSSDAAPVNLDASGEEVAVQPFPDARLGEAAEEAVAPAPKPAAKAAPQKPAAKAAAQPVPVPVGGGSGSAGAVRRKPYHKHMKHNKNSFAKSGGWTAAHQKKMDKAKKDHEKAAQAAKKIRMPNMYRFKKPKGSGSGSGSAFSKTRSVSTKEFFASTARAAAKYPNPPPKPAKKKWYKPTPPSKKSAAAAAKVPKSTKPPPK
jgi:hypothetical protein